MLLTGKHPARLHVWPTGCLWGPHTPVENEGYGAWKGHRNGWVTGMTSPPASEGISQMATEEMGAKTRRTGHPFPHLFHSDSLSLEAEVEVSYKKPGGAVLIPKGALR